MCIIIHVKNLKLTQSITCTNFDLLGYKRDKKLAANYNKSGFK